MKIKLTEISKGGLKLSETKTAEWLSGLLQLDECDVCQPIGDVKYDLVLKKSRSRVRINGTLVFSFSFVCSRCLKEQESVLKVVVNESVTPEDKDYVDCSLEVKSIGDVTWESTNMRDIDLDQVLVDHIRMALPLAPSCPDNENCKAGSVDVIEEWEVEPEVNKQWKEGIAEVKERFCK